eukprot:55128-Eustigmatos_ZCMA.PRE.2
MVLQSYRRPLSAQTDVSDSNATTERSKVNIQIMWRQSSPDWLNCASRRLAARSEEDTRQTRGRWKGT